MIPGRPLMAVSTGKRDRSLDFERPEARRLREHEHLVGRDVGHGVNRQAQHRIDAGADNDGGEHQDEELVPERKINQSVHCSLLAPDAFAQQRGLQIEAARTDDDLALANARLDLDDVTGGDAHVDDATLEA